MRKFFDDFFFVVDVFDEVFKRFFFDEFFDFFDFLPQYNLFNIAFVVRERLHE